MNAWMGPHYIADLAVRLCTELQLHINARQTPAPITQIVTRLLAIFQREARANI